MSNPYGERYGILDMNNAAEVAEYEQHFYTGYAKLTENKLVRILWDWDDEHQRLKTRIPYSDQIVYTWRDDQDQLLGVMAVNLTCKQFQGSMFNFAPEPTASRYCEILNVMSTVYLNQYAILGYAAFIRDYGFGNLVAQGYEIGYATCTKRRLRPYQRLGAELLTQTMINDEKRFFLRWPLRALVAAK